MAFLDDVFQLLMRISEKVVSSEEMREGGDVHWLGQVVIWLKTCFSAKAVPCDWGWLALTGLVDCEVANVGNCR